MGQKIHPKVFRLSTIFTWDSKWFGNRKNYISNLREDVGIREFLLKKLRDASVDRVEVDRNTEKVTLTIFTAKPGVVIGRSGAGIDDLKKQIKKRFYEVVHSGSIPLHNLRADVNFARVPARTIYGAIGVKVWIYRGEVFEAEPDKTRSIEKPKPRKRS